MIRSAVRRLLNRSTPPRSVTLCESCGQVCTHACRADAIRERDRIHALSYPNRLL